MNHEITAVSHDLELGGSHRSMKELHAELTAVMQESGHDPSGLLGDLLFSMEMNAERATRMGQEDRLNPNDVLVALEGGLVQAVCVGDPALAERLGGAVIVDYDVDGADPDELLLVAQPDGRKVEAVVHFYEITEPAVSIGGDLDESGVGHEEGI